MSTTTARKASKAASQRSAPRRATVKKRAANTVDFAPSENEVRERAFQIFMNRGGEPGHEMEDWLQAERELRESLVEA